MQIDKCYDNIQSRNLPKKTKLSRSTIKTSIYKPSSRSQPFYQCYITSFTCKVVKMEREPQKIVTDCTPTCCSCNPDLPTCAFGFTKNRDRDPENPEKPDHQYFINQDFHHYSIQYKIDSSMQPTYREEHTNVRRSEVTSALRRHVMATRIASRQNPGIIRRRTRNENHWQTHIENSVFLRRQSRLPTQFGKLIPEQHGPASLSHLASPQGPTAPKLKIREEDMEAMKISGDTDSEKSIDQSRRKNRTKSFHACRNVRCVDCDDYSPLSYHRCFHRNCALCDNHLPSTDPCPHATTNPAHTYN